jgi:ankyrin repeat protein
MDTTSYVRKLTFYSIFFYFIICIIQCRACAYGIEPIVKKLIDIGVDVNTQNCHGYSPLHEACRRGFDNIVRFLISSRSGPSSVDVNYLTDASLAGLSPFACSPPQRPLAESTRSGFIEIMEVMSSSFIF